MTTAATTMIPTGTWTIDPVHSVADFRVRHFGVAWLRGSFDEFDLQLTADDDGRIRLEGAAPVERVSFPNEQLRGHLMGPDFFDAQLHPQITFRSTDVDLAGDGTATARGELTIKGTTVPVELRGSWAGPVEGLAGEQRIGLELAGEIDRTAFGIDWQANLATGQEVVSRGVKLQGEFELTLQA